MPKEHRKFSSVLCDDLEGWDGGSAGRGAQEGGDIGIHTADSLRCTAEKQKYCKATILQLKKTSLNGPRAWE